MKIKMLIKFGIDWLNPFKSLLLQKDERSSSYFKNLFCLFEIRFFIEIIFIEFNKSCIAHLHGNSNRVRICM